MIRAMIADDESTTRNGLMNHIHWQALGVSSVQAAASGAELLSLCQSNPPDIVISDICMPGMNGIDLCTTLRQRYPQCRIIFLSGYSDKQYLMAAIELSAVSYIEKPIDPEKLERVISRAVEECKRLRGSEGDVEEASLCARFADTLFAGEAARAYELVEEAGKLFGSSHEDLSHIRSLYFFMTYRVVLRLSPVDPQDMTLARELQDTLGHMQTQEEMQAYLLSRLDALYPSHNAEKKYSAMVRKIIVLIERDLASPTLSLSTLAAEVYLTPAYLSGLFKRETGATLSAYIIQRRISRAQTLLSDSSLKLYNVAREVGYTDQNYFAKLFKRETGFTPSEYKEKRL